MKDQKCSRFNNLCDVIFGHFLTRMFPIIPMSPTQQRRIPSKTKVVIVTMVIRFNSESKQKYLVGNFPQCLPEKKEKKFNETLKKIKLSEKASLVSWYQWTDHYISTVAFKTEQMYRIYSCINQPAYKSCGKKCGKNCPKLKKS